LKKLHTQNLMNEIRRRLCVITKVMVQERRKQGAMNSIRRRSHVTIITEDGIVTVEADVTTVGKAVVVVTEVVTVAVVMVVTTRVVAATTVQVVTTKIETSTKILTAEIVAVVVVDTARIHTEVAVEITKVEIIIPVLRITTVVTTTGQITDHQTTDQDTAITAVRVTTITIKVTIKVPVIEGVPQVDGANTTPEATIPEINKIIGARIQGVDHGEATTTVIMEVTVAVIIVGAVVTVIKRERCVVKTLQAQYNRCCKQALQTLQTFTHMLEEYLPILNRKPF